MRLFHFSDDPAIARFEPRPVAVPSARGPGRAWLNGPLVWAIEEAWQGLYLFPRDCPRILLRRKPTTTEQDRAQWWGDSDAVMIAYVEDAWAGRLAAARLHRYDLPRDAFEDLADAGMWVARTGVTPRAVETLSDLPAALGAARVEVRTLPRLTPLRDVWSSSLHASGVRLRNAADWAA